MAKSVLDIVIKLSKQGGADKETVTGLVKVKSAMMDAAAVAGTMVAAGYAIKQAYDATVGTMVAYADQVRSISQSTGLTSEESSRLIQVLDDMKVSYEDLQKVVQKNGDQFDYSIEGLAQMSEQYKSLGTEQEKAAFMQERFGKSWVKFVEVMDKGSSSLLNMNDAVSKNLILTDKSVQQAREHQIQIDNLKDSYDGAAISIGSKFLPALNVLLEARNNDFGAINWRDFIMPVVIYDNIVGLTQAYKNLNPEIDSGTQSYTAWAQAAEKAAVASVVLGDAEAEAAEKIKAMNSANTEFLSTMGSMQSTETSYQGTLKTLTQERMDLEAEKQGLIAQGYSDETTQIMEVNAKLDENSAKAQENATEHEMANKRIMLSLLERKLTADGVLDDKELLWLLQKGVAWGVYSQTVVYETQRAITEANNLTTAINGIPASKTFTMVMNMNEAAASAANYGGSGFSSNNRRVKGGPVSAGEVYLVGEDGPEVFVPDQSGSIVPNGGGSGAGGGRGGGSGGGNITVVLSMNSVVSMADREEIKKIQPYVFDMIREAQAQGVIR